MDKLKLEKKRRSGCEGSNDKFEMIVTKSKVFFSFCHQTHPFISAKSKDSDHSDVEIASDNEAVLSDNSFEARREKSPEKKKAPVKQGPIDVSNCSTKLVLGAVIKI